MQYKTSIFRKNFLLAALLALVWLTGCVQEEFESIPPQTGSGVRFTLTVPDVEMPSVSSRTMAGTGVAKKEDEIKTVDILVFDASKTPAVYLEWVSGTGVTQDLANNNSTVNFSAVLSPTTASTCIVVVANRELGAIASEFRKGETTKDKVMEDLLHSHTGKWTADGSSADGYTRLPMYGEKEVAKITPSMNSITGINMKRMLARIDIRNSASNFTVEEVYLANYNTIGYIAPAWDADGKLKDPAPDDPNLPADGGKKTEEGDAILYSVNGNTPYNGEIYTFEAPAAEDAGGVGQDGASSRKDAVCLIVKGKIGDGKSTFYRVDFTKTGEIGEEVEYLSLKRNYKYIITVTEASGIGYESFREALASYTVMSNLKFRLILYDRDKVKDVVYNGQYMLGVGESEISVTQHQNNGYAINVFTDHPGGWKATVTEGNDWLGFSAGTATVSGVANEDTQLLLRIPYYHNGIIGTTRTATVTLTAGRLTYDIKVTQGVIDPGIIKFVDAYGNELENGLFFPIRNPDGDELPIEPQTVYVMFSVDKIDVQLFGTEELSRIKYPVDGLIPQLYRDSRKSFTERVQAFTVHPNPRLTGDGTSADTPGWWWRWDMFNFYLYDKDGSYLGSTTLPINQGELQFSFRYYPTINNSRTYKVHLGAEQYLQLFVNNNWTIESVEELDVIGDDGTGLIRTDTDNDIIAGRMNADSKMYQESVVDNDNDGKGNDVVNRGYDFRLKLHAGKWKEGKSGTIRITFRNVMHTVADAYFPFYRTLDLQMVSETKSYTTAGDPLFYLYPLRFDNRLLVADNQSKGRRASLADAETICGNIGDGWRLPTASELLLSFAYVSALGGNALGSSEAYGQNIYGWYQNWTGNYWASSYYSEGSPEAYFELEFGGGYPQSGSTTNYFRCVRDNNSGATKYPYLSVASSGVTIVSRDANGGVDPAALFASGEVPDNSSAMNKIAPKFQIENTSSSGKTWEEAKVICEGKGDGWRLPTQRELYLVHSLGGSLFSIDDQGFGSSMNWGGDFQKLAAVHWALTERDGKYWVIGHNRSTDHNRYEFSAWTTVGTVTWPNYRCVRTVTD
ncbi:fimbrial protein [Bacteroides sp. BFG-257]|uniref:fimbrial protein n=1 Tax=Bacteroides TaxID=816 RepID=UPI001CCA513D|nr:MULTISPECIES: fimbrial protein [Bacteroides]UBD70673.1 FimB/Mfa2 family fimbrial subunit [Bacteroides cellulosilyticus]UVO99297.1 fimbrial protein [Bacteroides sp. BFG-257]